MKTSNPIHLFNVNDSEGFKAFYRYQKFTKDELLNATPIEINNVQPRFVELFWASKPATVSHRVLLGGRKLEQLKEAIIAEDDLQERGFVVYKADSLRNTVSQIKKIRTLLDVNTNLTPQSAVREIVKKTPEELTQPFLEAYSKVENFGLTFAKNVSELNETENFLELVKPTIKITSAFVDDLLNTSAEDEINLKTIQKTQEEGALLLPTMLSPAARELIINSPVSAELGASADTIEFQPVGYIIEKYRNDEQGFKKVATRFITGAEVCTYIDTEVKHEDILFYTIQNVYHAKVPTKNETGQDLTVGILISSKPLSTSVLSCVERQPPEPPSDFTIRWDHSNNKVLLSWALPLNPEKDIKYIQIFRRQSIQEPFVLQAMFDFNDIILPPLRTKNILLEENIDESLIIKTSNFIGLWFDEEITKQSRWQIYAVCCVDAHGQSSSYSMQLAARYNQKFGGVETKLISEKGAPKPYPNLLLKQDMFSDSIKDQGHTSLTVAFTPEYLDVVKDNGVEYGLLKTGTNDSYVLQIINIDSQQQQTINIKLKRVETRE